MTTKLETQLDQEFESMGVKVYVYHIRDVKMFGGITIATETRQDMVALSQMITALDFKCRIKSMGTYRIEFPGAWIRKELARHDFHGVAICDRRDRFSRKRGRIIAKGRLLKTLWHQEEQDYIQNVYAQIEYENRDIEEES